MRRCCLAALLLSERGDLAPGGVCWGTPDQERSVFANTFTRCWPRHAAASVAPVRSALNGNASDGAEAPRTLPEPEHAPKRACIAHCTGILLPRIGRPSDLYSKPAGASEQLPAALPDAERAMAPQALISPPEALRRLAVALEVVHPGSGSGACLGRTRASGWCPAAAADAEAGLAGGPEQALVSPKEALRRLQAVVSAYYPQELEAGAYWPAAAATHGPKESAASVVRPKLGWMRRSWCLCLKPPSQHLQSSAAQ